VCSSDLRDELGLKIEKPDDALYAIIKSIYDDFKKDMELDVPFEPQLLFAGSSTHQYSCKRVIIESIAGGIDAFITEGQLTKQVIHPQAMPAGMMQNTLPQTVIQDNRTFEGWRHI
jgi:hypothetical protein